MQEKHLGTAVVAGAVVAAAALVFGTALFKSTLLWGLLLVSMALSLVRLQTGGGGAMVFAFALPFVLTGLTLTGVHRMGPVKQISAVVDDVYSTPAKRGETWHIVMHTAQHPHLSLGWGADRPQWKTGDKVEIFIQTWIYTDVYGISVGPCPTAR